MANKQIDYNVTDKITVTTKFDKEDDVIADYGDFGWQLYDRKEDKIYFDAVHLTFTRPHKIGNKDELQLLQVYYEDYFNQLSDWQKHKHKKSNFFAFIASFLLFGVLSLCVYMMLFAITKLKILFGVVLCTCLVFSFLVIKINKSMRKKENAVCAEKIAWLKEQIDKILLQSKTLIGGTNEK